MKQIYVSKMLVAALKDAISDMQSQENHIRVELEERFAEHGVDTVYQLCMQSMQDKKYNRSIIQSIIDDFEGEEKIKCHR